MKKKKQKAKASKKRQVSTKPLNFSFSIDKDMPLEMEISIKISCQDIHTGILKPIITANQCQFLFDFQSVYSVNIDSACGISTVVQK